jgi:DNA-binding NarL/FixJ family response regulator
MVIEAVADGSEADEKIETFMPDVVFMDVRLSGESGLELTKRIKASHPKIIVIILTHYDVPEYREAAHDVGADGFIIKESLDLSEIAALLGSLVSDRRKGSIVHETKT